MNSQPEPNRFAPDLSGAENGAVQPGTTMAFRNPMKSIMQRHHHLILGLFCWMAVLTVPLTAQTTQPPPPKALPAPARFEKDINAFLAADKTNPPPQQAILFIGSSIFRLWTGLERHMAPLPVFNRAFGGSLTTDVLHYMDKIALPYKPRIIVYYCGSNDVNAGRKAAEIFESFRLFAGRVHETLPKTRIFYASINRAPQKKDKWDVVDEANRLAREFCTKDPSLGFIDLDTALFDAAGEPRLELYLEDKLHFKDPAYDEFSRIVKPVIAREWADQTGKGD